MLRSLRALWLFLRLFSEYALYFVFARFLSSSRRKNILENIHRRNAKRLALGFSRLRGVFIKVGQVISVVGTFLPKAYAEALERLQDRVPARPFKQIQGRLVEALGPNALSHFQHFEQEPIAAASLAQVHFAITRDGRRVAVKVLYPGIESLIRRDLKTLRMLLPLFKLLVPIARLERQLDQLSAMLQRETDYKNERANLERLQGAFARSEHVVVPEVVDDLTNAGVLTMSFEEGTKITNLEALRADDIDPESVAKVLVEAYVCMLFEQGVFHADPHPGNFLVRPGPKLVLLDYGAVEEVTDALREGMKSVVLGAITKNQVQILQGIERMGFVAENGDRELLARVGRDYIKVLSGVTITNYARIDRDTLETLVGYERVKGKLRDVMKSVEYPEGFFYVERTLALLFGLVAQLAPEKGLPGLLMPHATQVFARGFVPSAQASNPAALAKP